MGVKVANSGSFKKGNPGKPQGAVSKATRVSKSLDMSLARDIHGYMDGKGFNRFMDEMERLKGYQYTSTFLALLEYVKPKLSRVDVVKDTDQLVINIFGKTCQQPQNNHTTIEDIIPEQTNELSDLDL